MDTRSASPGELGGPTASGLELRDALGGVYKDVDEGKRQVLVEFPHETVDSFKTVFGNRAFADSFQKRLPTMCWQHDIRNPIGHALTAQVTPRVNELRGQFDDFDAVPDAKRAFSQIQSGTITDFSFGFKNAKFERADGLGKGVRRITDAFMAEFSPVTIGSIPGAIATGLREDASAVMDIERIVYLRDNQLITPDGFRALIEEHHPELSGIIVLNTRDKKGDDQDADDPSGSAAMNLVSPVKWTAIDSALHTAFGPNGEALRVNGTPDGAKWHIADSDGNKLTDGEAGDIETAKDDAQSALDTDNDDDGMDDDDDDGRSDYSYEVPDEVTAHDVRNALISSHPGLAYAIRGTSIVLADPNMGERGNPDAAAALVITADAAIDAARNWVEDLDTRALPDEIVQALALLDAAGSAVSGAMEALDLEGDRSFDIDDFDDDGFDIDDVPMGTDSTRANPLARLDELLDQRPVV